MERRNPLVWLVLLSLIWVPVGKAAVEGALPASWFELPEDTAMTVRLTAEEERAAQDKAATAIERVIQSNSDALDQLTESERQSPTLAASRSDWKLSALILDLGLSASGVMGVMVAKGDATASLFWRRPQTPLSNGRELEGADPADLSFTGADTPREVQVKLEPVIRALMATGEVKDEPALRRNLLDVVLGYQTLVQNEAFQSEREWNVSKLRLDFSIDISGKVNPVVTVGGGIRLRFEWEPSTRAQVLSRSSYKGEELGRLLSGLSDAMRSLPYESLAPTGYKMTTMRFGLGIFGDGKFGLVKVAGSVFGYVYLARKAFLHPVETPDSEKADFIPVMEWGKNPKHLEYATQTGIRATPWTLRGGEGTVYSVPKEAFRKGMEKAVKMSAYLAERSSRSQGKRWELYQIKADFALSLSGSMGLVSIGGTGDVELSFQKTTQTL